MAGERCLSSEAAAHKNNQNGKKYPRQGQKILQQSNDISDKPTVTQTNSDFLLNVRQGPVPRCPRSFP